MNTRGRYAWVLLVGLALLAGVLVIHELRATAALRRRAAKVTRDGEVLTRLRADRERFAALQPTREQNEQWFAEQSELARERAHVASLQAELERRTTVATTAAPPSVPAPQPAERWTDAGRSTPEAMLETVMWSIARGEIATLADAITFDAEAQDQADAFFASLPDDLREQFRDSRELVAAVMAAKTRTYDVMTLLDQPPSGADEAELRVQLSHANGRPVASSPRKLRFRRDPNGWRLLVPAKIIEGYRHRVLGSAAVAATSATTTPAP